MSSFKISEICRFLPNATFLPELQSARNRSRVYGETSNHLDQQAKHSGERMLPLHVYETILFCRMVNYHFPMVEIPFPDISSPKIQSVDLFCFSILMLSSMQSLVISSQGSTKSDALKFGPVSEQGAETTFRKETAIFFRPSVS